jgi:hypothetical protein
VLAKALNPDLNDHLFDHEMGSDDLFLDLLESKESTSCLVDGREDSAELALPQLFDYPELLNC